MRYVRITLTMSDGQTVNVDCESTPEIVRTLETKAIEHIDVREIGATRLLQSKHVRF